MKNIWYQVPTNFILFFFLNLGCAYMKMRLILFKSAPEFIEMHDKEDMYDI